MVHLRQDWQVMSWSGHTMYRCQKGPLKITSKFGKSPSKIPKFGLTDPQLWSSSPRGRAYLPAPDSPWDPTRPPDPLRTPSYPAPPTPARVTGSLP